MDSKVFFHDNIADHLPYHANYAADFLKYGIFFWDRHVFAGIPAINPSSNPLHPEVLLCLFLPPFLAYWLTLGLFLLIDFFGYSKLLQERFELDILKSDAAALLYLGLAIYGWIQTNSNFATPFAVLPWMILFFERFRSKDKSYFFACILSVVFCLYASDITLLPIVVLPHAAYLLAFSPHKTRLRDASAFFLFYTLGALLYAPVILTMLQDAPLAIRSEFTLMRGDFSLRWFSGYLSWAFVKSNPLLLLIFAASLLFVFTKRQVLIIVLLFILPPLLFGELGIRAWLGQYLPLLKQIDLSRCLRGFLFFPPLAAALLWHKVSLKYKAFPAVILLVLILQAINVRSMWAKAPPEIAGVFSDQVATLSSNLARLRELPSADQSRILVKPVENFTRVYMVPQYHHLIDAGGMATTVSKRYRDFYVYGSGGPDEITLKKYYAAFNPGGESSQYFAFSAGENMNELKLLNARYIALPKFFAEPNTIKYLESQGMRQLFSADESGITIYENPDAAPKVFMAGEYEILPDMPAMFGKFGPYPGDITKKIFLTKEDVRKVTLSKNAPMKGSAELIRYEPDYVAVRFSASMPGLLVLTDAWHPDWEASVNGKPSQIFPAYWLFRGITIQAGENQLAEFRFAPKRTFIGFKLAFLTFLILSAYFCWIRLNAVKF